MSDRRALDDLRAALREEASADPGRSGVIRLDPGRAARTGIPEVIFAETKPATEVLRALVAQAGAVGRAVASRVPAATATLVERELPSGYAAERHERARGLVVARTGSELPRTGGRIGVVAAGTSDVPWAAEATLIAVEMGVDVEEIFDVGVAGLHRLLPPLEGMLKRGVDAVVVAAGMDGALPSVVAGLVPMPVIGLPTPVGYGHGGGGAGALSTMLQSCAPGLTVVNIGNGIGAGAAAAVIANRVAAARVAAAGQVDP